jgi:hypothetical protein
MTTGIRLRTVNPRYPAPSGTPPFVPRGEPTDRVHRDVTAASSPGSRRPRCRGASGRSRRPRSARCAAPTGPDAEHRLAPARHLERREDLADRVTHGDDENEERPADLGVGQASASRGEHVPSRAKSPATCSCSRAGGYPKNPGIRATRWRPNTARENGGAMPIGVGAADVAPVVVAASSGSRVGSRRCSAPEVRGRMVRMSHSPVPIHPPVHDARGTFPRERRQGCRVDGVPAGTPPPGRRAMIVG